MALLDTYEFTVRDFVLAAAGVFAAGLFLWGYPSQDPKSAADRSFGEQKALAVGEERLSKLGFSLGEVQDEVSLEAERALIDSLQKHFGRNEMVQVIKSGNSTGQNIAPYFWDVRFILGEGQRSPESENDSPGPDFLRDDPQISVRLDTEGRFIEFINESGTLPERLIQREALKGVFSPSSDTGEPLWPEISDSLLNRMLYFDLEQNNRDTSVNDDFAARIESGLSEGEPYRYSREDAITLARYHMRQSAWNPEAFKADTVFIDRIQSVNAANVEFSAVERNWGQEVSLEVVVAPTGALMGMEASYNTGGDNNSSEIWELIRVLLIMAFCIGVVFIFYLRIKARAVDTRSALIVAIIAGIAIPAATLLDEIETWVYSDSSFQWIDFIMLTLRMGMSGAFSTIGFFVLAAIGDSITRQYWPEKLSIYDYLRQGMVFNKPVGLAVIRSVIAAFVLTGLWTLFLWLNPTIGISVDRLFLTEEVWGAPLYLMFDNAWFSLLITMAVFLVMGSQIYAYTGKRWTAVLAIAVGCLVASPVPVPLFPIGQELLASAFVGVVMAAIFIYWDFFTLLLSFFLFSSLIDISSGWAVANSPDLYVFLLVLGAVILLTGTGILFIYKGKEERRLPRYVPEYVEELAQEERIRQELQIAREVQQSFLPVSTPAVGKLELAAVCEPAFETGGDYYDFIRMDEDRLAVTIGDVSGKGIQAAFYMTLIKGIVHSLCREVESPAELLKKANKLFYENAARGTFISLVYGIIDTRKGTFRFARAGHNPVLHVKGASGEVNPLQPKGLGLGMTPDNKFDGEIQELEIRLENGDVLILYTDGIVEALNGEREFYGVERFALGLRMNKGQKVSEMVKLLMKDIKKFVGDAKQHDDMTMVVVKYNSNK